jgi:hypothetical protein
MNYLALIRQIISSFMRFSLIAVSIPMTCGNTFHLSRIPGNMTTLFLRSVLGPIDSTFLNFLYFFSTLGLARKSSLRIETPCAPGCSQVQRSIP